MGILTFILDTSVDGDNTSDSAAYQNIMAAIQSNGFNIESNVVSDDYKSGCVVFRHFSLTAPAPDVAPEAPKEIEITLASAEDQPVPDVSGSEFNLPAPDAGQQAHSDLLAHAAGVGHIPSVPEPTEVPAPEPVVNPTKTGIVFVKSLLPSEPVPYKCDTEKDRSELHVGNVAYQRDLVTFTFRNTVFKFPIEQDQSSADSVIIRTVISIDNSDTLQPVFLKVVEDPDDNHVVFGKQDTEQLGLIEQLSTQS